MTTRTVTSRDGTSIGLTRLGEGPGVVLVQGAMGTADHFSQLAAALASKFTVWVPDRRGRGLSPLPYRPEHSIARDVEDLDAVLAHSGARRVFGLSSGAVIALTAAAGGSTIDRLAVFEPPLYTTLPLPAGELKRFEAALARGDTAAALTAAGKAVALVPAMNWLPRWFVELIVRRVIAAGTPSGEPSLAEIALTLQYDFRIVSEQHGKLETWRDLRGEVLRLGGSKSPRYLAEDLDALQRALPSAGRVTLPGLDHSASWDPHPQRNRLGNPQAVAIELVRFFNSGAS